MPRALLLALFLAPAAVECAVVQGVILDSETGRPLARTVVNLAATQGGGTSGESTVRSDSAGSFLFSGLNPGAYLLTVTREGFAKMRYGAKCWNCPGAPIYVTGDDRLAIDIRMKRLAAISGMIWDENQVGIPNHPVLVFSATRPLQRIGHVETDDRGNFRIGQLPPGTYYVRTAPKVADDGASYLSTFYPEGTEFATAHKVTVDLEHTANEINFRPIAGKLCRLQGKLAVPAGVPVNGIDLISDVGRVSAPVMEDGSFLFTDVAPGRYELAADGRGRTGHFGAWTTLVVEHDMETALQMYPVRPAQIDVRDETGRMFRGGKATVTARRRDLDGPGPAQTMNIMRNVDLAPGNWEVMVTTGADAYPVSVTEHGQRAVSRRAGVAEGWNQVAIGSGMNWFQITLSSKVAALAGQVSASPNQPAAVAPVFLETLDLEPPDPPLVRTVYTDQNGAYQFAGLPPGRYRIFSSFDLDASDRAGVQVANAAIVTIAEAQQAVQSLLLYRVGQ